jgi:hypothetical protein
VVVYPDCSRPPVSPSEATPATGGILGYLDITLLPPATTQVTVYTATPLKSVGIA